jgi:hypothetical protein
MEDAICSVVTGCVVLWLVFSFAYVILYAMIDESDDR